MTKTTQTVGIFRIRSHRAGLIAAGNPFFYLSAICNRTSALLHTTWEPNACSVTWRRLAR